MFSLNRTGWRRDVLVGLFASFLTGAVLIPVGWAALREQRTQTEHAQRLALLAARDQAQRAIVDKAADILSNFGGPEKSDAESMQVTTDAVAPEVPQGAYLLIDKKSLSYAVGDIVVFRVGENNYLGRVVAVDKQAGHMTVGRNGEADRKVELSTLLGRGVLNTR